MPRERGAVLIRMQRRHLGGLNAGWKPALHLKLGQYRDRGEWCHWEVARASRPRTVTAKMAGPQQITPLPNRVLRG